MPSLATRAVALSLALSCAAAPTFAHPLRGGPRGGGWHEGGDWHHGSGGRRVRRAEPVSATPATGFGVGDAVAATTAPAYAMMLDGYATGDEFYDPGFGFRADGW